MFENLIESSPQLVGRKKTAFLVSFLLHGGITCTLVTVSLIYYQTLPENELGKGWLTFLAPPAPPPPPAPPAPAWVPPEVSEQIPPPPDDLLTVPSITYTVGGITGGIPGGVVGGVPGSVMGNVLGGTPQAPPPPPPPRVKKQPIRVGGNVQASRLVHRVEPEYPELARKARISGTVVLSVTVDEKGNVAEIRLRSGHPLFNRAAVDAVRRWKYSPMLLNGEPFRVVTTVSVSFVMKFVES